MAFDPITVLFLMPLVGQTDYSALMSPVLAFEPKSIHFYVLHELLRSSCARVLRPLT